VVRSGVRARAGAKPFDRRDDDDRHASAARQLPGAGAVSPRDRRRASRGPPGWRGAPADLRLAGLLRALAQAHDGEQTEETVAAAWQWLRARTSWRTEDICDHLLAAAAPRVGVEKSPENSSREEYLVRLAAAYPRARFVHLARHPTTSVASMIRVWKDLGYWNITPELFPNFCVGVWYYQHLRIRRFVSALPPDRALTIRAEDALNDPHNCLPDVCRRLGVDASAAAVDAMCHPERAPHARLGPRGALGGGDAAFLASPAPHAVELPGSLELPVQWSVDPWLAASAAELAGQLGYGSS
jgi:hypothetical protein